MTTIRILAPALLPALLLTGCVTTTVASRTWGPEGASWVRYGTVETIRETVVQQQGDPAAGAAAGAGIGGLLGGAMSHHDHAAGTIFGAIGGAMVGAAASQGAPPTVTYEVWVRFDDGGTESFVYAPPLPFRAGDRVSLTPQGLARQ